MIVVYSEGFPTQASAASFTAATVALLQEVGVTVLSSATGCASTGQSATSGRSQGESGNTRVEAEAAFSQLGVCLRENPTDAWGCVEDYAATLEALREP